MEQHDNSDRTNGLASHVPKPKAMKELGFFLRNRQPHTDTDSDMKSIRVCHGSLAIKDRTLSKLPVA